MNQETVIIPCRNCGAKNRVRKDRLKEKPLCGKCKSELNPETIIVQCKECGAKNRLFRVLLEDRPRCGRCGAPLSTLPYHRRPVPVSDRNFGQEVLSFPGPVLMEFFSNSCGYCRMLDPVLDRLAAEYAGRLKVAKLNIEQNPATASRYDILSVPAIILFKNGKETDKLVGSVSKEEIERHLRAVL